MVVVVVVFFFVDGVGDELVFVSLRFLRSRASESLEKEPGDGTSLNHGLPVLSGGGREEEGDDRALVPVVLLFLLLF